MLWKTCILRIAYRNNPIYLDRKSDLVRLILLDLHNKMHHVGPLTLLAQLRRRFWVPQARRTINTILYVSPQSKCMRCVRTKLKSYAYPDEPASPDFRVTKCVPSLIIQTHNGVQEIIGNQVTTINSEIKEIKWNSAINKRSVSIPLHVFTKKLLLNFTAAHMKEIKILQAARDASKPLEQTAEIVNHHEEDYNPFSWTSYLFDCQQWMIRLGSFGFLVYFFYENIWPRMV